MEGLRVVELEGQQEREGGVFPLGLAPVQEEISVDDTKKWFREHKV